MYVAVNFRWVAPEVVPETLNSLLGDRRVSETVSEVVEQSELISVEDIGVWLALYSSPDLVDRSFKDRICSWVNLAVNGVSGRLQGTSDGLRASGIWAVGHGDGEQNKHEKITRVKVKGVERMNSAVRC